MRTLSIFLFAAAILASCKKNNDSTPPAATLTITNISPDNGPQSTVVTITGTGFSTIASEIIVKFNGNNATVQSATATQLTVVVPNGAGTGPVTVQRGAQIVTGPVFNYTLSVNVTTLAGSDAGFADGTGTSAKFYFPVGIICDAQGNVYVGDASNDRIRKITPAGLVTTFAGSTQGNVDGTGTAAKFNTPVGVCTDAQGNFYVGDIGNYMIRKITPGALVSMVAGGTEGSGNGQGIAAQFKYPVGVCTDLQGNIYVADNKNHSIRKITPTGLVTTFAGGTAGTADGNGTAAQFDEPYGICSDAQGNIYVADNVNHRIRKITPAGVVSTIAGSTAGMQNGNAATAKFNQPDGICVDAQGNIYVSDYYNHCIRMITPAGVVSTLAGGIPGYQDGNASEARFDRPGSICLDTQGNLYVADRYNHRIRKIALE